MHRLVPRIRDLSILLLILPAVALGACRDAGAKAEDDEEKIQQDNYARLARQQPARNMNYSPTRSTINFWIDTWDKPGKLSYVYLQASNGQLIGYYIFKGLPVSYCAAITPTGAGGAPSIDGVYYSAGGACNTYYGRDATTNSYIEYTAGQGINPLIYERPLPRQNVRPLGFTEIKDVK